MKLDESIVADLQQKYGPPAFYYKNDKSLKGLNEIFWTSYAAEYFNVFFVRNENIFYLYNMQNGKWEQISEEALMDKIAKAVIEYALEFVEKATVAFRRDILISLKGKIGVQRFPQRPDKHFIHIQNGVLEFREGEWILKPFSSQYHSRNQLAIAYDPAIECSQFIEKLLRPAITEDDIHILKLYVGQCLLGTNLSQTFLMLIGTPGGGKGTLVNMIEQLIGGPNCDELRTEHLGGRFEIGRFEGKSLLIGKDVAADFLQKSGARRIKSLTGNDTLTLEKKGNNTIGEIVGCFNVIIVSNSKLQLQFENDEDAWRRRILVINYERPSPTEKIVNFDKLLISQEGSDILNWALEGASELLAAGGLIVRSEEQKHKAEVLLLSSDPIGYFVKKFVEPHPDSKLPVSVIVQKFYKFCKSVDWNLPSERRIQTMLKEAMFNCYGIEQNKNISFNGRAVRGYAGCRFIKRA